jgi:hypothetical protein
LRDPLFLGACLLYAVNRWLLVPFAPGLPGFFRHHFNDVLLIPAALPLILTAYTWLGLRPKPGLPRPGEIVAHLALWSVICEWLGPMFLHMGTGDPWDVLAYSVGAVVAGFWWHLKRDL